MLGSGLGLVALGAVVIVTMPLPIWIRSIAAALWIGGSAFRLARLSRRYRDIVGYRIYADGSAEIVRADGRRAEGRMAAGTVVLPRLAWLRVHEPGGGPVAELVTGDPRASPDWRRFQVICRHVAAC